MVEIIVILALISGAVVIGGILFFPLRWLLTRNNPEAANSPKVTPSGYLQAALVVVAFLTLAWHMEAGNKAASIIWGLLALVGSVWLYLARRQQNDKDQ